MTNATYKLKDVFTPASPAALTYVSRQIYEDQVNKALTIPGMQLCVTGPSGVGKTTLLQRVLNERKITYIATSCFPGVTTRQLVADAFVHLNKRYKQRKYFRFRMRLTAFRSRFSKGRSYSSRPPWTTSPQSLGQYMGLANLAWIIEDAHHVHPEEKPKMLEIARVFSDIASRYSKLKVIIVGWTDDPNELFQYGPGIVNRISEIFVPAMERQEQEAIIRKGEKLLNISLAGKVKDSILGFSQSLPGITHKLCFDLCYRNDITVTQAETVEMDEVFLPPAVSDCLQSNAGKYEKILFEAMHVCRDKSSEINDILIALCETKRNALCFDEILQSGNNRKSHPGSLYRCLQLLVNISCLLSLEFEQGSDRYSFSSPMLKAYTRMHFFNEKLVKQRAGRTGSGEEWVNSVLSCAGPDEDCSGH